MKKIGLIMIALLSIAQAEFTRADTGIVTDSQTGLEWQDNTIPSVNYETNAINYCNELDLEGTGWRLPNINELKSLIVDTQFAPSIDAVFENTATNYVYWSSSSRKEDSSYKWYVNFSNGIASYSSYNNNYNMRCVR
jgi:hypothetical protein